MPDPATTISRGGSPSISSSAGSRRACCGGAAAVCLTAKGRQFLIGRGIEIDVLERKKRPLCRTCIDWSERKHHLGGAVGAAVLGHALVKSWAVRGPRSRAVTFSALGEKKFTEWYSF